MSQEPTSIDRQSARHLYGEPADYVSGAHAPCLDATTRRFIETCTFLVLSSKTDAGDIDMSPRGGPPGFIHILDDQHIAFLDVVGNKKLHTVNNLAQQSQVGMLFMIPGVNELLRAYGKARALQDVDLIQRLGGNPAKQKLVIHIEISKIFPNCSVAAARGQLWRPEHWPREQAKAIPPISGLGAAITETRLAHEQKSD